MTLTGVTNSKDALMSDLNTEYEQINARLRELQSITEQSQAEVQRLQKRSVEAMAQLKRVEDNLDTWPRADIKATYTSVVDIRTRLLTMQGQLDRVQQDRTQLERHSQTLKRVLDALEGASLPSPTPTPGPKSAPLSNETIVRIVQAQEAERQRLARQIHDCPAQSLTNFILQAEICQSLFDRDPDRAASELGNLKTSASTTFQKVRDFIFDLRPMMLDDLGLAPTIRRYVEAFNGKGNAEIHLNIVGEERRRMAAHTEVTMFRSVQELLAYTRDICAANRVDIILDVGEDQVKASLTFNGKPLEESEEAIETNNSSKVFSLKTLRERVELIGGTMEISGAEGDDNRVDVTLPVQER